MKKIYPKNTKTRVIKKIDRYSINSRNYASAYHQTLEEVPWPLMPEKNQKLEKIAIIFKNC